MKGRFDVRGNRKINLVLFLLAILSATSAGPAFAAPISCGENEIGGSRLVDETLRKIALLDERNLPFSGTIFLLSAQADRDLACREADGALVERELDRLSRRVRELSEGFGNPVRTVRALNRVLFEEERFVYDPEKGDPENYLIDRVLARKRGNCLGMTSLYLSLAERLGIPLGAVYVPSHSFVRYEGNGARINIETGEEGGERKDAWYARKYRLKGGSPYFRTLGRKEMIGVYLKSLGAAYSNRGRNEDALRMYREAALFFPELPDSYYNAGVSYQRMGMTEKAVAEYRKALSLDPEMASARGNLGTALCDCGSIEDGIREFNRALESDPRSKVAHAGLAKAYFARGEYNKAARHCDRAMEQGCRFEPSMLEALSRYRRPSVDVSAGP